MAYSTPAMIRLAVNPDGSNGTSVPATPSRTAADFTDAQLLDFIAEADATINSLIGRFYAVPVPLVTQGDIDSGLGGGAALGAVAHPVDYWSRNLAAYFATLSYRRNQDLAETDPVVRRYNATMAALNDVAGGRSRLSLRDNTTSAAGVGAGGAINPTYTGNLFDARDFNLVPVNEAWPFVPDSSVPGSGGWRW